MKTENDVATVATPKAPATEGRTSDTKKTMREEKYEGTPEDKKPRQKGTSGTTAAPKEGPSPREEFHRFFVEQLKDIYWAEKHLKPGLRRMSRAATSDKLAAAFAKHYDEGDKQIAQLETIFELLGEKPRAKRCAAMAGLLEEADGMISDTEKNSFIRDAGLILAAQKVEHYEIATYGTLRALSAYLPEKRVTRMLEKMLTDEKKTDESLTKLAESFINESASVE